MINLTLNFNFFFLVFNTKHCNFNPSKCKRLKLFNV